MLCFLPPATTLNATYLLRLQQETYIQQQKRKEIDRTKFVQQKSILFLQVSKNVTISSSSGLANILSTKKQRIHIVIGGELVVDCCFMYYGKIYDCYILC